MNKADLLKLQLEIESDYQADRAAVEQLLRRWEESRASRAMVIATAMSNSEKRPSHCAEDVIKEFSGDFTVLSITRRMEQRLGRKNTHFGDIARQAIHLLRQRGEVLTVIPGKGSRSGVYRFKRA